LAILFKIYEAINVLVAKFEAVILKRDEQRKKLKNSRVSFF
jgi:hypothetical protein